LEYLFNGIVGHVWDRHGNGTNPQLPHYWRRYLGVPDDSHPYHDYNPDDGAESADVAITQPTWLLHSILRQGLAGNDSILSALSTASPASPDLPP